MITTYTIWSFKAPLPEDNPLAKTGPECGRSIGEERGYPKVVHGRLTIETNDGVSCHIPEYYSHGRCRSEDESIHMVPWFITKEADE